MLPGTVGHTEDTLSHPPQDCAGCTNAHMQNVQLEALEEPHCERICCFGKCEPAVVPRHMFLS